MIPDNNRFSPSPVYVVVMTILLCSIMAGSFWLGVFFSMCLFAIILIVALVVATFGEYEDE
jgi:protein-S-isoprenylcysteine O-methyltransferase Ste14